MEVVIDGVRYLPENTVVPNLTELLEELYEMYKKSYAVAESKVPPVYVKDDDRGRPFDTAYNERERYRYGYEYAITEMKYLIESFLNKK
jgi:hypothetical protein